MTNPHQEDQAEPFFITEDVRRHLEKAGTFSGRKPRGEGV